ncbi:MAG: ABC transporter ATP-binding protein [Ilumatobacteraceae bacterium]|jgi:branched-chain amino acid transport system ATP-binding protein
MSTVVEAQPVLALDDIVVQFGGIRAVDGASMRVRPGTVRGLIGPNGAGKTTLFDVISGLRRPNSGTVQMSGTDVTAWSPTKRARHGVRRTFQRVQVFGRLSVADNLLVALEHHGGGGGLPADFLAWPPRRRHERERRERAAEMAEMCGLSAVIDQPAASLPIGLARQVELARALIDRPKLLLLDEPTSGLDETEWLRLGGLIRQVSNEHSCAIVLVEHNVPFVMDHCEQITVLELGRVIADGSPDEVRADPAVRAAYFD